MDGYDEAVSAAAGANAFAFRLCAELMKKAGDSNLIFSPFSTWTVLAALLGAATPAAAEALAKAIGVPGFDYITIDAAAAHIMRCLIKDGETGARRKMANALFIGEHYTIKNGFKERFAAYGAAMNVDFTSDRAADAVNRWASERTDGYITGIIDKFEPDTVAAIANAVFFNDRWAAEFDPALTATGLFSAPGGACEADFMRRSGVTFYYEDENVQAAPLNFTSGGGLYIVLPKKQNAAGLLQKMTDEYFTGLFDKSRRASGEIILPRFNIDSKPMELKNALAALGAPLFDKNSAPLTGGLIEENIPVCLSGVLQKAAVQINEEGASAAAVTVAPALGVVSAPPPKTFTMVCDRPFVFLLYDFIGATPLVLFAGILNRP